MANSTKTLQSVVDFVLALGDVKPILPIGGFSSDLALEIANDVARDMCGQPFPWKWNRRIIAPFQSISFQQDYAQLGITEIGYIEHAVAIDINNTAVPKPIFWLEAVRDIERTSYQFGTPKKICWLPNNQLVQASWPGANVAITQPLGAVSTPANPITNILDPNGNIEIVTTYGVTGGSAPSWPAANATPGTTTNDGSVVWTVVDPTGVGFRVSPLPTQTGLVYQFYVVVQNPAPSFTSLNSLLSPIPDDYSKFFRDGFKTYMHQMSPIPSARAAFPQMKALWLKSIEDSRRQGDREKDDACFVPDKGIMDDSYTLPLGAAWPYGPTGA